MGQIKSAGLIKRNDGNWHIDKQLNRKRICLNTGTSELKKAEEVLARVIEDERQARLFGVRPPRTFEEATEKYIKDYQHLRSFTTNENRLKQVLPFIGDLFINEIHIGSLQTLIIKKRNQGIKTNTINHYLKIIRRILNLAASEWIDSNGLTWLLNAPKIKLLEVTDARKPYPINWNEQELILKELPEHLKVMMIFAVNTGCRDNEICGLRWDWEVKIPELNTTAFIIPDPKVKNKEDRLVVLNKEALKILDKQRNIHDTFVFTYKGRPMTRMNNTAWNKARERAGLPQFRVHDCKHTNGRRLRSAGVSFEDRQDLLGHRSGRITTHYSAAELTNLIDSSNKACDQGDGKPELVMLRRVSYGQ